MTIFDAGYSRKTDRDDFKVIHVTQLLSSIYTQAPWTRCDCGINWKYCENGLNTEGQVKKAQNRQ